MTCNEMTFQDWNDTDTHVGDSFPNKSHSNSTSMTTGLQHAVAPFVSYYTFTIVYTALNFLITCPVALFGCFSNVINIALYLKMGVAETTTINILALSTVDLLVCATTFMAVISFNPLLASWKLPSGAEVTEIGFGSFIIAYPCLSCGAWFTTLLSVERCLCIMMPLKVKTLVTSRRVSCLIAVMAAYELTFVCLMFVYTGPPYTPSPSSTDRKPYLMYSFSIPSSIFFVIILISTLFLVTRLRSYRKQAWLKEALGPRRDNPNPNSSSSNSSKNDKKEQKAARFVIAICTMYLVCFTPNVAIFVTSSLIFPNLQIYDPYLGWFMQILLTLSLLFQTVSSSVNVFIYYAISSKYRVEFKHLFCKGT